MLMFEQELGEGSFTSKKHLFVMWQISTLVLKTIWCPSDAKKHFSHLIFEMTPPTCEVFLIISAFYNTQKGTTFQDDYFAN